MLRVFSLKSKIIMLSFSVGLTVAAFLLFMAYQFFKNDKLAYIFDSNETQLETIASEIRNEVSSKNEEIRLYTRQFNLKLLQGYSLPDTSDIEAVIFFEQGAVSKKELGAIYKKNLSEEAKKKTKNFENQKKVDNKISFSNTHVEIVEQNQVADRKFGVFYIYQSNAIAKIRQLGKEVAFVLTNSQSEVILSLTQNQREITLDRAIISQGLFINESLTQLTSQSRIIETNEGSILLSSAKLGLNDFYIVSAIPESIALKSFSTLFYRAILFFIFISSLIFAISYLFANYLTNRLSLLVEATEKISAGDFDISIPTKGTDEITDLTKKFNVMGREIQSLLHKTEQTARMEAELKTAQLVQATLFPPQSYESKFASIGASCLSASECGGDWWHFYETEHNLWIWIADATGHGAPAALLTSAAKSAVSVIESEKLHFNSALGILNKAICGVSKENMMMTCFLARLDKNSLRLDYCNASHEAAILINKKGQINKKDLIFLNEVNGPRLGEKKSSQYDIMSLQLNHGDRLILYTDGVNDLKTTHDEILGERGFFKILTQKHSSNSQFKDFYRSLNQEILSLQKNGELIDDVTVCLLEIKNAV